MPSVTNSGLTTAAFVVSICSAAITLSGLTWQLWLYRLQGARLKIQIVFSYAEDASRTWSHHRFRKPMPFGENMFDHTSPFGIEYGSVRVTNIGRTAVSVENISFTIRHPYRWNPRGRQTIQPMQFRHKDADKEQAES